MRNWLLAIGLTATSAALGQTQRGTTPPPPPRPQLPAPAGRVVTPSGKPVTPPANAQTRGVGPVQIQTGFVGSTRPLTTTPQNHRVTLGSGPRSSQPIRARHTSTKNHYPPLTGFFTPTNRSLIPKWSLSFDDRTAARSPAFREPRDDASWFKKLVGWQAQTAASSPGSRATTTKLGHASISDDSLRIEVPVSFGAKIETVKFIALGPNAEVLMTLLVHEPPFAVDLGLSPQMAGVEVIVYRIDGTAHRDLIMIDAAQRKLIETNTISMRCLQQS